MLRRSWFALVIMMAACGGNAPLPADLLPESVAGGWRRTGSRDLSASEAPDPVPRNEIERLRAAQYEGPGKLEARVYRLPSSGVALDLVQRWRPAADKVFFYHDKYFVVIEWQSADRKALQSFVSELEKRLGATTSNL